VLHKAAWSGNVDVIRVLLEHQAKVDTLDISGQTPLVMLCAVDFDFANPTAFYFAPSVMPQRMDISLVLNYY
jgi:hypothetical protein